MLAPWCEGESAEEPVVRLGQEAAAWWERHVEGVVRKGTLVVAPSRDRAELRRFASRTSHLVEIEAEAIAALEPDLAGRFGKALFFESEGHLDPRLALAGLVCPSRAQKPIMAPPVEIAQTDDAVRPRHPGRRAARPRWVVHAIAGWPTTALTATP
jgi:glycine/D-amino acid oxidase-like deaminating enzyme